MSVKTDDNTEDAVGDANVKLRDLFSPLKLAYKNDSQRLSKQLNAVV